MKNLIRKFSLDRAILWSLIGYGISFCSGPISAFLIATRFSSEIQGYYYTFISLLALSAFLELGFGTCIIQFTSHEYAHLHWVKSSLLAGPLLHLDRFISLARLSIKWYSIGAVLLFVGLGVAGEIFFRRHETAEIDWRGGWWLLCLATASSFPLLAVTSLLTGCDEVAWNAKARILSNLTRTGALIITLLLGCGLYVLGISAGLGGIVMIVMICTRWWPLLRQTTANHELVEKISWKREIWPFQWKIALSWASGYFIFSIFTPIIFEYEGKGVAGQFGITWALLQACSGIAQIFTVTRRQKFGSLISLRNWDSLRHLWFISLIQTIGVFLLLMCLLIGLLLTLQFCFPAVYARFLNWPAMFPILGATFLNQVVFSIATLARAEKKEPFLGQSIVVAVLCFLGSLLFGKIFGIQGIVWNYFFVCMIGFIWAIVILSKIKFLNRSENKFYLLKSLCSFIPKQWCSSSNSALF